LRNKKGLLVGVVGKHGNHLQYGVMKYNGAWYFDGNKLGKRKIRIVQGFFDESLIPTNEDQDKVVKLWKKLSKQGRF